MFLDNLWRSFAADLASFWQGVAGFVALVVIVVLVDLRFGLRAAKKRGERIRLSGALRRTTSKLVDYLCWIMLSLVLGRSIGSPLGVKFIPLVVMIYAIAIEIDSIGSNWAELRGYELRDRNGKPISFMLLEAVQIRRPALHIMSCPD